MTRRPGVVARLLLVLVGGYRRWVSPLLPPRCRFAPSCSAYAVEALQRHGAARGSWLAVRRLARCHPFHPGGYDPVPHAGPTSATMEGERCCEAPPLDAPLPHARPLRLRRPSRSTRPPARPGPGS